MCRSVILADCVSLRILIANDLTRIGFRSSPNLWRDSRVSIMYAMSTLDNGTRKRLARQKCGTLLFLDLLPCSCDCCFNCYVMDLLENRLPTKKKKKTIACIMLATEPSQCEGRQNKFVPICLPAWLPATRCRLSPENNIIFHTQGGAWQYYVTVEKNTPIVTRLHVSNAAKDQMGQFRNCYLCRMMGYALTTVPELGKNRLENGVKESIICPFSSLLDRKRFENFLFAEAIPDFFSFLFLSLVFLARNLLWRKQGNKRTQTGQTDRRTNELLWHWAAWQINAQVYQLC